MWTFTFIVLLLLNGIVKDIPPIGTAVLLIYSDAIFPATIFPMKVQVIDRNRFTFSKKNHKKLDPKWN